MSKPTVDVEGIVEEVVGRAAHDIVCYVLGDNNWEADVDPIENIIKREIKKVQDFYDAELANEHCIVTGKQIGRAHV